jgi:hypothetical protein
MKGLSLEMADYKDSYGYNNEDELSAEELKELQHLQRVALDGQTAFVRAMRAVNNNPRVRITVETGGINEKITLGREDSTEFLKLFYMHVQTGFVPPNMFAKRLVEGGIQMLSEFVSKSLVTDFLKRQALSKQHHKMEEEFVDRILGESGDSNDETKGDSTG